MAENSKKVALLISSFLPNMGGMEVGLHNIAVRLQKNGWEPVVIAPYSHVKDLKEKGWTLPYQVEALPPKVFSILYRWPWLGFKILDFCLDQLNKKHNFDFWHVTMGYPTGCAIVHYAEHSKKQVRYLIRCAGEDIQRQPDIGYGMRLNPKLDVVITRYLKRAQKMVAITQSVREEYRALGIADNVIYDVPNGVALDRFSIAVDRAEIRKNLGIKPSDFLILCVGRNHPKKNYKTLIKAGMHLREAGASDFKILCVGKGCQNLQKDVDEAGLAAHVILKEQISAGAQDGLSKQDLPARSLVELYKASDLFAFPSITETFGIAIVEAMAAGLPVIVGNSEGCRDIVENGEFGVMVDPLDDVALSGAIQRLMTDQSLRKVYQEKSLLRVNNFNWDTIVKRYIELYSS